MWDFFIAHFVHARQQLGLAYALSPEAFKTSLCGLFFVHSKLFHGLFLSPEMHSLFQQGKKNCLPGSKRH